MKFNHFSPDNFRENNNNYQPNSMSLNVRHESDNRLQDDSDDDDDIKRLK